MEVADGVAVANGVAVTDGAGVSAQGADAAFFAARRSQRLTTSDVTYAGS